MKFRSFLALTQFLAHIEGLRTEDVIVILGNITETDLIYSGISGDLIMKGEN